jgi:hypothetical protein
MQTKTLLIIIFLLNENDYQKFLIIMLAIVLVRVIIRDCKRIVKTPNDAFFYFDTCERKTNPLEQSRKQRSILLFGER